MPDQDFGQDAVTLRAAKKHAGIGLLVFVATLLIYGFLPRWPAKKSVPRAGFLSGAGDAWETAAGALTASTERGP